ncbi:hypothetical protein B0H17DRAFT_1171824 [Mycena rosella]|uniref:Tetratricopeptide repeat protein 39B n=1 Tax=Mycena rosella TaxID=1033263 RepID=A0AAD7CR12_MYCRO|nr:hypothetical protein B0H17DRAFT_1171824 [Mycena rosella]
MSGSSYRTVHTAPPPVKMPYKPTEALGDLPGVVYALDLFLGSKMHESEAYCNQSDPKKERLYFATGFGLIQCVKGLMSYADEDLLAALGHTKQGVLIAAAHRKRAPYLASRLAGYVVSGLNTTGVGFVKSMTDVERHAELVYAESLFEKALLGIVYSGDWLAFIREALNMRTTITIYRTLYKYICAADADTLILSLLPARLLSVVELFGYAADRAEALEILGRAGAKEGEGEAEEENDEDDAPPLVSTADEGVRRALCDLALLIFHLVLSSFTFDGVDVRLAARVVRWNLKRYPGGVFFLFGAGRLALRRAQPARALAYHAQAMKAQAQYRTLHHVSWWECAVACLALGQVGGEGEDGSLAWWRRLEAEAGWSKSIYTYGMAVCLLESAEEADGEAAADEGEKAKKKEQRAEAARLMERVPGLRQKIAGKSIPLEKFVARKARKFLAQGRLALPALEISYVFFAIAHAPRRVVETRMLPAVRAELARLAAEKAGKEKLKDGHWDDYCLARFLEGVCLRYVAFPDADAVLERGEVPALGRDEAVAGACAAFEAVFESGPRIELDHHLVYHAHYELGRVLACTGDVEGARKHFDLVLSGKYLEVGPSGRKGKYSMQNALEMRTHAAVEALHKRPL